jgi:aminoacrylate peracid reductase
MPYQVVVPKGSAPPLAPYSPGAKPGNALYVSGTLALDSAGNLVGKGDVKAQTRHILETIKAVVEGSGGSLKDITFNHIFLSDMAAYAAMNDVYREYFPKDPPARYCIRADLCGRNSWSRSPRSRMLARSSAACACAPRTLGQQRRRRATYKNRREK